MASKAPLARLLHVRDEIVAITTLLGDVEAETFASSYALRRAAEHAVLIISEAVRALDASLLERYPGPDWRSIRGIGNALRHEYAEVEPLVVWNVVRRHLPALAPVIARMISDLQETPSG